MRYITYITYSLKCKKINSKSPKIAQINKENLIILSKSAVCDVKKPRYIKEQEANGLLSSLGIKVPLRQIPLVGPFLF